MKTLPTLGLLWLVALPVSAQQRREPDPRSMGGGDCRDNVYNCADTPNPLPAPDTVWLEEMTWMDVRDALAAGKTTAKPRTCPRTGCTTTRVYPGFPTLKL